VSAQLLSHSSDERVGERLDHFGIEVGAGATTKLRESLSLPSGSRALSPATCIGPYALSLRMFGSDVGGTDNGVHAHVLWYGSLNRLLGATDYNTFDGGNTWWPTDSVRSSGGFNLLLPLLGSTSARIELTPLGGGSRWKVDDLYVDPWASRD
jgi:hypothetical protein